MTANETGRRGPRGEGWPEAANACREHMARMMERCGCDPAKAGMMQRMMAVCTGMEEPDAAAAGRPSQADDWGMCRDGAEAGPALRGEAPR